MNPDDINIMNSWLNEDFNKYVMWDVLDLLSEQKYFQRIFNQLKERIDLPLIHYYRNQIP